MKKSQIVFAVVGLIAFIGFVSLQEEGVLTNQDIHALTFSNTQTWDPELYAQIDGTTVVLEDAYERITLPAPPANDSEETQAELAALHEMEAERSAEKLEAINREAALMTAPIGNYTFAEITNREHRPYTRYLFKSVLEEYNPVILRFKQHFDRVRPSYLDPTLTTALEVPGHPAYPSGHSSQVHLFAHIMSDLDPTNSESYWESAQDVARNREVAGLHYPSDSEAGRQLAEQFYALLKETAWYKTALENAQSEWE